MNKPKHVIWITTDHMRYDGIGAHGNPAMHTPNLNRLVHEGVTWSDCYAQNPLCMPSRCSFMTGLYPQQTGVTANGHSLPPDFEPTVARVFKAAGYQTTQIGKLHFQPHEDFDLDPRPRHTYGFDFCALAEEPGCYEDAYIRYLRTVHPEHVKDFTIPRPTDPQRAKEVEGYVVDAPWQASFSGWIADQFHRWFRTWGGRHGAPQFMHLGFYAPHPTLNPTTEMMAPYADAELPPIRRMEAEWNNLPPYPASMIRSAFDQWSEEQLMEYRRKFYGMVTGVDMALGAIIKDLEDAGVLDDTLIVFGSDHGDYCGDHSMIAKNTSMYGDIMHLPLVMRWPNGLGATGTMNGLTEMVDVLPTLLGLCNAHVPDVMVGRNYADALRSDLKIDAREDVFAYHEPGHIMLRTDTHSYRRYVTSDGAQETLFDLTADPHEQNNIAEDPSSQTVRREMRDRALDRALSASRSAQPCLFRF